MESFLLIGWLNRGLLASDGLDWLYSSSARAETQSGVSVRVRRRERGTQGSGRGRAAGRVPSHPWVTAGAPRLAPQLPRSTTFWGAFSFARGCQLRAPARNNRLHLGFVHPLLLHQRGFWKENPSQVPFPAPLCSRIEQKQFPVPGKKIKLLYLVVFLVLHDKIQQNFFFFFFYLFIYFWLHWVFVAARGLSLCCGPRASHCGGFSCCRARALGTRASVVVARRI